MKLRTGILLFSFFNLVSNSLVAQQVKQVPFKDEKSNLYGFKDEAGKLFIPCKYTFAYAFSDGLAAVNIGGRLGFDKEYTNDYFVNGGKWGYINETGKLIIPAKYDGADPFYEGFAIVDVNGKKAFIDKTGKAICPFMYDMMNPFSEGLAAVASGDPLKYSYIDTSGKVIITGEYSAADNFLHGKARVTRYGAIFFINKKGERLK